MDFRDSADEAAVRKRLRSWLIEQAGRFPTSGDAYWAKAGEWHQALFEAGFFGTSWPKAYGGHDLPPVYDVIVDEEIAKAGAPARPEGFGPDIDSVNWEISAVYHDASPDRGWTTSIETELAF